MTTGDGLYEEMNLPWRGRRRPQSVDADTASRLLDGSMTAADAPPGYARVADVLAAAAAPATAAELSGEAAFLDAVRTARAEMPAEPRPRRRPRALLVAAAMLSLLLVSGLAAAVTGTFGTQTEPTDGIESPGGTGANDPDGRGARGGSATSDDDTDPASGEQQAGLDATGPGAVGLCRAYGAGTGDKTRGKAFRALAAAAAASPGSTDAERITAYCAVVIQTAEAPPSVPSGPPDNSNAGGNGASNQGGGGGNGNPNPGGGNGNPNAGGGNGNGNPGGGNGNGNGNGNG
jgi:hypothetical protein